MEVTENHLILYDLLEKLAVISKRGPIPSTTTGDKSVGMTLLNALGINQSSTKKSKYHGIVVVASRKSNSSTRNRVNLFAQVPDWQLSNCKSSREIVEKYGYESGFNERRLYCTVETKHVNSQGLKLIINREKNIINEIAFQNNIEQSVVIWRIEKLEKRLLETHPETVWVQAVAIENNGQEYFHYRKAIYTGQPKIEMLIELFQTGTISIDHLICKKKNRVNEKGPLFKIDPINLSLLFPEQKIFDLMSY
jgi:hypothetical protein